MLPADPAGRGPGGWHGKKSSLVLAPGRGTQDGSAAAALEGSILAGAPNLEGRESWPFFPSGFFDIRQADR